MDVIVGAVMGVGLAAACGLRVFLPCLVAAVAAWAGWFVPSPDFAWVTSPVALATLGVAAVAEVVAMHVPWLDHALDVVASPASVVAGALVAASALGDLDPTLRWTAAVIAGGGAAGLVQAATVGVRATSTAFTGGLGNPLVAFSEAVGALTLASLAVVAPWLALACLCIGLVLARMAWLRWRGEG
jgi:hypothetical protein